MTRIEMQTYTKSEILASVAVHGLRVIGRNKWTDGTHEYTMRGCGDVWAMHCVRVVPCHNWNEAVRDALRPGWIAAQHARRER